MPSYFRESSLISALRSLGCVYCEIQAQGFRVWKTPNGISFTVSDPHKHSNKELLYESEYVKDLLLHVQNWKQRQASSPNSAGKIPALEVKIKDKNADDTDDDNEDGG